MLPGRGREDPGAAATLALLRGMEAPQAVDEDRVVGDGIRGFEDATQELVVACGRQRELGPERFLLRSRVPVPVRLEVEHGAITVGKGHSPTVRPTSGDTAEHPRGSSG